MNEKINVKEIIKVGLILFAITAISAALLAFVNSKTAPLIAENDIIKEQTALKNVMPDAAEFKELKEYTDTKSAFAEEGGYKILKAMEALGSDGSVIGYCVITETSGYDVGIQTVTGIDSDLKVTGIDIIAMNETPGLGAKANNDDFKEQYAGKAYEIGVSKTGATDTDIQAISGATKTSRGVTMGVNGALATVAKIAEGGDK